MRTGNDEEINNKKESSVDLKKPIHAGPIPFGLIENVNLSTPLKDRIANVGHLQGVWTTRKTPCSVTCGNGKWNYSNLALELMSYDLLTLEVLEAHFDSQLHPFKSQFKIKLSSLNLKIYKKGYSLH